MTMEPVWTDRITYPTPSHARQCSCKSLPVHRVPISRESEPHVLSQHAHLDAESASHRLPVSPPTPRANPAPTSKPVPPTLPLPLMLPTEARTHACLGRGQVNALAAAHAQRQAPRMYQALHQRGRARLPQPQRVQVLLRHACARAWFTGYSWHGYGYFWDVRRFCDTPACATFRNRASAAPDLSIEPGRADESKECKGWDPRPTACATAARGRRAHACQAHEVALLHMTVPLVQPLHQD